MLIIYLALKFTRKTKEGKYSPPPVKIYSVQNVLDNFEKHRAKPQIVEEVNNFLFHVMETIPTDEAKSVFKEFFALEAKIHQNDESKIFHSLHQHLHPLLVEQIHEAQFPGLTQKFINCVECLLCSRFITKLDDFIIRTPWISQTLSTIMTMVKISSTYADMFKDTFLTVTLIVILGGPLEVLSHPAQFTSVVVITLSASILVPLVTSSLHLVSNNPDMIRSFTGVRSSVVIIIHLACSFLNPLLLINRYETAKEKIRIMTKRSYQDSRVPRMIQQCRLIKMQLTEFWKIELGRIY